MDHLKPDHFKKWMPVACLVAGGLLIGFSQLLANETGDEAIISHIAGQVMLIAGVISVLLALVTYFLKDHEDIW
jgi:Na+-driven multidrug efflux pump